MENLGERDKFLKIEAVKLIRNRIFEQKSNEQEIKTPKQIKKSKNIESIKKKFPNTKAQEQMVSLVYFNRHVKKIIDNS